MKKILIIILGIILITGCTTKKEDITKITCTIDETEFTLTITGGKITEYVDKIEGKMESDTLEVYNSDLLVNTKTSEEAKKIMTEEIKNLGGNCVQINE